MPAIMFMSIWQGVGFHMIIWLAGLQTIPAELYEAAEIDGASSWQQFRYVTWPGLLADPRRSSSSPSPSPRSACSPRSTS